MTLSPTWSWQMKHLGRMTWLNVQLRATTPPQYTTTMQSNVLRPKPEAQIPALKNRLQALQMDELSVQGGQVPEDCVRPGEFAIPHSGLQPDHHSR